MLTHPSAGAACRLSSPRSRSCTSNPVGMHATLSGLMVDRGSVGVNAAAARCMHRASATVSSP
jgi:hypothetical protein